MCLSGGAPKLGVVGDFGITNTSRMSVSTLAVWPSGTYVTIM